MVCILLKTSHEIIFSANMNQSPLITFKINDKVLLKGVIPRAHPARGNIFTVTQFLYQDPISHIILPDKSCGGPIHGAVLLEEDSHMVQVTGEDLKKVVPVPRWFGLRNEEVAYMSTVDAKGGEQAKVIAQVCAIWYDEDAEIVKTLLRWEGKTQLVIVDGRILKVGYWTTGSDGKRAIREGPSPPLFFAQ